MLCPMRMNRLALLSCLVSLASGAQSVPDAGVAAGPQAVDTPSSTTSDPATTTTPGSAAQPEARPTRATHESAAETRAAQATDEQADGERDDEDASGSEADDDRDPGQLRVKTSEEDARAEHKRSKRGKKSRDGKDSSREKRDLCEDEDLEDDDSDELSVLAPLQLDVDGRALTPTTLELHGLHRLTDAQVRAFIRPNTQEGSAPTPANLRQTLRRLARTGLFSRVEPRVRVTEQGAAVLEVHLEEHPIVTQVEVEGLRDIQLDEILEELLHLPPRYPDEDSDEDDEEFVATLRVNGARGTLTVSKPCPPQHPPREWLARMDKDTYRPGIVLGGVTAAMQRALRELRSDGYMLASLSGTLTPDGKLTVIVDEGRLESVDVVGVEGAIADRVRDALDLKAGDVFLRSDARRAMERLEARLPFLEAKSVDTDSRDAARRRDARIIEERAVDGVRHYRTQEQKRREKRRRENVEVELSWGELFESWRHGGDGDGITLEGRKLVVHVRPRRPDVDVSLLPIHTQVTGLAPGLAGSLRLWDGKDRIHTTLDAAAFLALRLGGQKLPDDPEGTKRQRRVNLLGGAKVEIPAVGLAELGAQAHDFTDTLDRWRMSDIDSSLYSALINRPDRDYFRRKGVAGFATFRWSDWLAGVEYHSDRYETLRSFSPPLSLFRRDSPPFPNAPVTEGRFQSVVARVEYASGAPRGTKVGSLFRTPETALLDIDGDWDHRPFLHAFATLEVGEGPAAAGADERFWKLVSDFSLVVPTSSKTGLRLRLRGAGGDNLPEQKREALGGWTALRGFGFKEFKGDVSMLASAEYRWHAFGLFTDLGTVRGDGEWTDPRLGVGASFHFTDDVRLDVAWRTDEKATATPEARLFFVRTF
ncbi:hypothetical protein MFU01_02890 [Myxococcus fulvus]|uniref:Bacterial surface antigen (D15) domain-containing protein n=2 Tax=Myxococcus fulvus TaxID=33 RepID=A0A511SUW3_MYXFU|nr:hypothetical protein MFU01_02890 [Myxococcus fulvus]